VLAVAAAEIEYSSVRGQLEYRAKSLGAPRAKASGKREEDAANRRFHETVSLALSDRRCSAQRALAVHRRALAL
jgi:hypothetical protein